MGAIRWGLPVADAPFINAPLEDALNRLKRASERGTGCHLTKEMIEGIALTFLAEVWHEEDPRNNSPRT
jgi:hypothetical protein